MFLTSSLAVINIYIRALRSISVSPYPSFIAKPHCKSLKSVDLISVTKNCK